MCVPSDICAHLELVSVKAGAHAISSWIEWVGARVMNE